MQRKDILKEAARLTATDRQKIYGEPRVNHERIAALWSTYLDVDITPEQASICMLLVKVARVMQTPDHLDSYVDMAAYAAISGEIACAPSE